MTSVHRAEWAIVLFSVGAVDGVCPTDGLTASIWGILTKGNMMLQKPCGMRPSALIPSAPFLGEGRWGWSWKPQEQLMLFPEWEMRLQLRLEWLRFREWVCRQEQLWRTERIPHQTGVRSHMKPAVNAARNTTAYGVTILARDNDAEKEGCCKQGP